MGNMTLHAEGTPECSFQSSAKVPIESLKAYFAPKQEGSGDPSPSNVRPISGWTGLNVTHSGKNLYDFTQTATDVNCFSISTASPFVRKGFVVHLPSGTYTFKGHNVSKSCYIYINIVNLDGTYSSSLTPVVSTTSTAKTFTLSNGQYIVVFDAQENNNHFGDVDIQLEQGSIATEYEPYCGGTIPVTFPVLGKNKFDKNAITDYCRINASGEITLQSGMSVSDYIPVVPGQQYTITTTGDISGNKRHAYYDENKQYLRVLSNNPTTITIPEDAYYIRLTLYDDALDTTQFELGSTATTYEAYNPNNTVYGGYVDIAAGKVVATYKEITYDGSSDENWAVSGQGNFVASQQDAKNDVRNLRPLCDKFLMEQTYANASWRIRPINNSIYASTVEGWRTWLSENPIQVVYELTTPIEYPLTPTTVNALRGQNHIWSSATDKVEVDYDLHETKVIAAAKRRIAANQPHKEIKTGSVATFTTDMRAPITSCKINFVPMQEGSGDPSPTNVRAIKGWTGLTTYRTGKNLLNKNGMTRRDGYNYNYGGTEDTISGTGYFLEYICVKPNSSYTISGIGRSAIYEYTNTKAWIRRGAASNGTWSFTTSDRTYYIRIQYRIEDLDVNTAQLELGSAATSYTPYNGTTIPLDWTSEAGTVYGGYVNLVSGEVWKTYGYLDLGTLNYTYRSELGGGAFSGTISPVYNAPYAKNKWIGCCSAYPYLGSYNDLVGKTNGIGYVYNRDVIVKDTSVTLDDASVMKAALNGIYLSYELATPELIGTLTPTQLKTLRGVNNIYSSTNGNSEIMYWTHK